MFGIFIDDTHKTIFDYFRAPLNILFAIKVPSLKKVESRWSSQS